jgi:diguanylate cyclase (GGDEF)-like protein
MTRSRLFLFAHWPVLILVGTLVPYAVARLVHGEGFNPPSDDWLSMVAEWSMVAVALAAARRAGNKQPEMWWAGGAVLAQVGADTYWLLAQDESGYVPTPSPADAGYLLFYVLMLGVLIAWVRRWLRTVALPVLLDTAVGTSGAAAVLAVLLQPVLTARSEEALDLGTVINVAYPLLDLILIAMLAGVAAFQGGQGSRHWALLTGGLLLFTAADVMYALVDANGGYSVGSYLDIEWALGISLIVLWMDRASRPGTARLLHHRPAQGLAVPGVATLAGLGVLLLGSQQQVSVLALVLASATLALAAIPLAFRQRLLRKLSRTDELTGLPNRRALYTDAPVMLAGSTARQALMLLDLDRFKDVNDSLGHDLGDALLIQVAARLSGQLRPADLLARLGGDEFAVLLADADEEGATEVAARIREALEQPVRLEGISLQATASIGIALFPTHGTELPLLLRKADMAMYKAKASRSGHHFYTSADDTHGEERLRLLTELRTALAEDQFVMHYQPKVDLDTGLVNGAEALVRWNHPQRGLLQPSEFLSLAEESGLMHTLTLVVLSKSLDQAARWKARNTPLAVAVNISASSLVDAQFPAKIAGMLALRGLTGTALVLEIPEEFLLADRERARDILTTLRTLGIQIAVDDFGTGYSTLSYLRDLPIDELKLDSSFIRPMADSPRAASLVASTIALAHGLGLRMVAEGVESGAIYDELSRYGCDRVQGHYMSHALPAEELDAWMLHRDPAPVVGPWPAIGPSPAIATVPSTG